jgi:hypothetical protein
LSVKFLGHIISGQGIQKDPEYVKSLSSYPKPTTVTEMRSFLGLLNYQRKFIKDCSTISEPLYASTVGKRKDKVVWTPDMDGAFETLLQRAQEDILLSYPMYGDDAEKIQLWVDASGVGSGAMLAQPQNGEARIIAYASKVFTPAERDYSTTGRELAAMRWAVKTFRAFLYGVSFDIYTDHASLVHLKSMAQMPGNGRLARTLTELNEFDFTIHHVRGVDNVAADVMSRILKAPSLEAIPIQEKCPPGFAEIEIRGGADSMIASLDAYLGNQFRHTGTIPDDMSSIQKLRESLTDEILGHPTRYRVKLNQGLKRELLAARQGILHPPPEFLLAFSYLLGVEVVVHHGLARPVVFSMLEGKPSVESQVANLLCLAGTHYNYLRPKGIEPWVGHFSVYFSEQIATIKPVIDSSSYRFI